MSKKADPKPKGFVVDHKESNVRYAVSPENYNPKIHTKVRSLKQHETVWGYVPKAGSAKAAENSQAETLAEIPGASRQKPADTNTTK